MCVPLCVGVFFYLPYLSSFLFTVPSYAKMQLPAHTVYAIHFLFKLHPSFFVLSFFPCYLFFIIFSDVIPHQSNKQVFPLTISGGLSAGAKAKEAKLKKERKAADIIDKKIGGKKVRKTVLSEEMEMNSKNNSNIAAFSDADLVDLNASVEIGGGAIAENEVDGEVELSVEIVDVDGKESASAAESVDAPPLPFSLKSASRPGITSERIRNIFDPYVTGIAVRP